MGSPSRGQRDRCGSEHPHEHGQADAEHRPVKGHPLLGVERSHWSQRSERRQSHRHANGQERAEGHSTEDADQPVASRDGWTGSEGPHHPTVIVRPAELAGHGLNPEDQADQRGDRPESSQSDRFRLEGKLHLGHDSRGHVELGGRAPREQPDDLLLDLGDVKATVVKLKPVADWSGRRRRHGQDLSDQRRGQEHKSVGPVDVVLDHSVVEDDEPHQPDSESEAGRHARSAKARQTRLRIGIEAHGHDLADVHAEEPGRAGGHDHLVSLVRIRPPTLHHGWTVLVDQHAVQAAENRDVSQGAQTGGAVIGEGHNVGHDEGPDAFHVCQAGDFRRQRGNRTTGVRGVNRYGHL